MNDKPKQIHDLLFGMAAVDLAPTLEPGIPKIPSHPHLIIDRTINHARDGKACGSVMLPEHCGCHVDAPYHLHGHLDTVEKLDVTCLLAPAVLYDFAPLNLAPGDMLTPEMIENYEREKGLKVGAGEIALINFGWMRRYWRVDQQAQWFATNAPGMTEEATILFKERRIKAIGGDTVGVEIPFVDGKMGGAPGHLRHWLPNNILIIEMLTNLEKLGRRSYFAAMPLPIVGGSGSPIRPIGFTEHRAQ